MAKITLNDLYIQAWQFMRRTGREHIGFDDKVYENLLSALYPRVRENPLYCEDIVMQCLDRFLDEDAARDKLEKNRGEELLLYIEETFERNKRPHYLLIPIDGARLTRNISFADFHFITGGEAEKEKKIAAVSKVKKSLLHDFIDHTKKSRSCDFMEYPMLVMKVENISSNVRLSSSFTAQKIFQILKLMVYYLETEESIYEMAESWHRHNYHVAVIGEEHWQFGHRNWWNLIQCKYSLDFLAKKKNKLLFEKLVRVFITEPGSDELFYKFANALELFERSLEQVENDRDKTLSMMLLFSAAESLLTEWSNEKSLRLSVIWSRLVSVKGKSGKELSSLIRDAYSRRNDFVHAGNLMYSDKEVDLRTLHQMLAKLIMLYVDTDKWIAGGETADINRWKTYVREVFEDAVYS